MIGDGSNGGKGGNGAVCASAIGLRVEMGASGGTKTRTGNLEVGTDAFLLQSAPGWLHT